MNYDYINDNNSDFNSTYNINGFIVRLRVRWHSRTDVAQCIGAKKLGEKMKQFLYDWIHLTQGEMFIKYWHLWLFIVLIVLLIFIVVVWWHDDIFNQHHPKTLQERVDAQKEKDLRDKLKQWERHIEPFLIKRGDSVESILESKKLYFNDDDIRKQLDYLYMRKFYPNRHPHHGPIKPSKQ